MNRIRGFYNTLLYCGLISGLLVYWSSYFSDASGIFPPGTLPGTFWIIAWGILTVLMALWWRKFGIVFYVEVIKAFFDRPFWKKTSTKRVMTLVVIVASILIYIFGGCEAD